MRRDWWAPLTGVGFVVLLVLSFVVGGEPPDAEDGAAKVVEHYVDNKGSIQASSVMAMISVGLLVFFGAVWRKERLAAEAADAGPDRGGVLPHVAFAGVVILATGAMVDNSLSFAIAEAADGGVEPTAVLALQAYWDNDFFPMALGLGLLFASSGLSIVRHGGLSAALGWVALLIGLIAFTPLGFFAFLAGALWLLVVGVLLTVGRRAPAVPPSAAV